MIRGLRFCHRIYLFSIYPAVCVRAQDSPWATSYNKISNPELGVCARGDIPQRHASFWKGWCGPAGLTGQTLRGSSDQNNLVSPAESSAANSSA